MHHFDTNIKCYQSWYPDIS